MTTDDERQSQERVSGSPFQRPPKPKPHNQMLWMNAPALGSRPPKIRKSELPNLPVDYDQETGKAFVPKGPKAEENRRRRVVHGWAFSEWTAEEKEAIQLYLSSGEMNDNFPDNYRSLHETVK